MPTGIDSGPVDPGHLRRLKDLADLSVRRAIAVFVDYRSASLDSLLERAYPFGDDPLGRQVWSETLARYARAIEATKFPSSPNPYAGVRHGPRVNVFQRKYRPSDV